MSLNPKSQAEMEVRNGNDGQGQVGPNELLSIPALDLAQDLASADEKTGVEWKNSVIGHLIDEPTTEGNLMPMLGRPAVFDYTSLELECSSPRVAHASHGNEDLRNLTQSSFCEPMNLYDATELDQESFIMEGMSIHDFRHSAISPDCSFRRGFTRPERPPLRTTSELIREIEVEFELHKIEKEKNEQAQAADAEFSCHEPLPLPKVPERVDSEVNFDPEVKDSSDSNANEEYESKSNENGEFEAIAEMGENPKTNEGEDMPESQSENDIGCQQVQIDEFAGGAVGGKKIEEDGEDKIATEISKSQAVIGEQ